MRHWYRQEVSHLYGQKATCKSNPQKHFIRPGKTFCQLWNYDRITLIGGPAVRAGWRAVFPNEKCELSAGCTDDRRAGRRPALKGGGPAGCGKGRGGPQKRAALRPASVCSPLARPSVQLASPRKIHVFHLETRPSSPPDPPALRLVLSIIIPYINKELGNLEYNISQNNVI